VVCLLQQILTRCDEYGRGLLVCDDGEDGSSKVLRNVNVDITARRHNPNDHNSIHRRENLQSLHPEDGSSNELRNIILDITTRRHNPQDHSLILHRHENSNHYTLKMEAARGSETS
jgi:hypothetical protein